jgi:hypothetical protein
VPLLSNSSSSGPRVSVGPSIVAPGVYEYLLERAEESHRPDPRGTVGGSGLLTDEQLAAYRKTAPPTPQLAALRAGRDVTLPAWRALPSGMFGALRYDLPWVTRSLRVSADDRVRPGLQEDILGL